MSELWDRFTALQDYASMYGVPTVDEDELVYRVQKLRQKARYQAQAGITSTIPESAEDWSPEKKAFVSATTAGATTIKPVAEAVVGKGWDLWKRITSGEVSKDSVREKFGKQIGRLMKESERKSGVSQTMRDVTVSEAYPEQADLYPQDTTLGEVGDFADMARERQRSDVFETVNFMSGPGSAMVGQTLIDQGVDPKVAVTVEVALGLFEPIPLVGKVGKAMTAGKGVKLGTKAIDIPTSIDKALNNALQQKGIRLTPFELEEAKRLMTEFSELSEQIPKHIKAPGETPPAGPVLRPGETPGGPVASQQPIVRPGETPPGGPIAEPGMQLGRSAEEPGRIVVAEEGQKAVERELDIRGGRARQAKEKQRLLEQEAGYKRERGQRMTRAARMARKIPREMQMSEEQFTRLVQEREAVRVEAKAETAKVKAAKAKTEEAERIEKVARFGRELRASRTEIERAERTFIEKLPKEGEKFKARDLKVQAKPLRDRLESFVAGKGTAAEREAMGTFQSARLPKIRAKIKKAGLTPDDYFPKSYLVKHVKKAGGRRVPDKFKDGLHQYVMKTRLYFAPGTHYKGKMPSELAGPLEGTGLLKQLPTYTKGKGLSPEDMIEELRASGYRLPDDATEYDLYGMIVDDYLHFKRTGKSRHFSNFSQDSLDDDIAEALLVYEKQELETALEAAAGPAGVQENLERWIHLSQKEIKDPKFVDELRPAMETLLVEQERIATRLADPATSAEEAALLKARNRKVDKSLSRMEAAYDVDTDFPFGFNVGEGGGRSAHQREVTLYHGKGGPKGGGAGGDFFSSNPERAASFGDEIVEVRVPREVFEAGQRAARKAGSGTKGDVVLPDEWVRQAKPSQVKRAKPYELTATDKLDVEAKRLRELTDPAPKLLDEKGIVAADLIVPAAAQRGAGKIREAFRVIYLSGVRSVDGALESLGKAKYLDESVRIRMRKFREKLHSYEKYVETNSMGEITKYKNTIKNLTDDEWDKLVDILDKKAGTALTSVDDPKLRYAAQRVRTILDRVADEAEPQGVLIGRQKSYFPHRFTKEQLTSDEFIKELAAHSGLSEAEASEMINIAIKNRKGAKIAYNLERKRELFHPGFRRDRDVLVEYLMESYSRIGQARYFSNKVVEVSKAGKRTVTIPPGGENAIAERLINSIPNRYTKAIINNGFNQILNADISVFEPVLRPLRWFNAITLLSTSAVAQAGQVTHLISEAGLWRTIRGMKDMVGDMDLRELARFQEWHGRVFTRAWRQDAKKALTMAVEPVKEPAFRSAALWPNIRQEVGRAAGKEVGFLWGLPTMDMYLRVLADRTGRRVLEAMVKAGDVDGLKLLGKEVGLDLTGVKLDRGLISSAEGDAVGRWISDWTQFRTDPLHMPEFFNRELGRTVFQFLSFMRQHSRYVGRTLKELTAGGAPGVRKRAAKRTARFLVMGAIIGEGVADIKALMKGYGIEGEDYSDRDTWEKLERALYTKRISWKNPVYRILQNYSILGGIGIFQMVLENMIRPGASITRLFGASADLVERMVYRPLAELATQGPEAAGKALGREAVSRIPHVGYQLQREFLGTERQGIPGEGGLIGRLYDYWSPERQELRELTKTKEKGQRAITKLRRERGVKEEPKLTDVERSQNVRGQIARQRRTMARERLLNMLEQAKAQKDFRDVMAIKREAKRLGFRLTQE